MQPTTFTFAPRLKKTAPTAPSGAATERPTTNERRSNGRQQQPADQRAYDNRQRSTDPRSEGRRAGARADAAPTEARRPGSRRTDGQPNNDGRRAGAPWRDRSEQSQNRNRPERSGQAVAPRRERPTGDAPSGAGRPFGPGRPQRDTPTAFRQAGPQPRGPQRQAPSQPRRSGSQGGPRQFESRPATVAPAEPLPSLESFFADAATLGVNPAASFADLELRPETRKAVDGMGITVPTPIQASAIPVMLAGRDIVGQAKTGSGKTLAFALPTVERCDPAVRGVQALILVPTRELAIQVGHVIEKLTAARRLKLTLLYGGRSLIPEARALAGGAQIVVGTPGRTLDHLRQRNLSLDSLRIFVLDEGDEMLDRGFAPDVERILAFTPPTRQTALFSATVPPWVMQTAARHLKTPVLVRVDTHEAPPEIEHIVYDVDPTTRSAALRTLLDQRGDGPVIVFGRTKHGVKKLARQLEAEGFPVVALHGNLSQNARERAMVELRAGTLPILVATNVAARGIDIADVGQVINYEVPESAELFTHRVGRTGRMGRSGEAITFVTPDEAPKWRQIERVLGKTLPRRPWSEDGEPESEAAATRASAPAASAAAAPAPRGERPRPIANRPSPIRAESSRADAPRPDGERRRPRWRRAGR